MPELKGISISLLSQYDCGKMPEYEMTSTSRATPSVSQGATSSCDRHLADSQQLSPREKDVAECVVPIYPASQFWIEYSCSDPGGLGKDVQYLYFQLFVGTVRVLSWGIGDSGAWLGKVMFGIYSKGTSLDGRGLLEKRVFMFPRAEDQDAKGRHIEIKVFRSKARKVTASGHEMLPLEMDTSQTVDFRPAGDLSKKDPKGKYAYALIDPVDQPYVCFRFIFHTMAQIQEQCFADPARPGASSDNEYQPAKHESGIADPTVSKKAGSGAQDCLEELADSKVVRKLSIPPRTWLLPTTMEAKHKSSPKKKGLSRSSSFTEDFEAPDLHAQSLVDGGTDMQEARELPKPLLGVAEDHLMRSTTPNSATCRTVPMGFLGRVVASALKRRGANPGE